jgi:hypothetical protein
VLSEPEDPETIDRRVQAGELIHRLAPKLWS